ncbi:shikimate kinase [Entomobacter blattae]|nr:shikimate kinase [Entomobacter blattae]
MNEEFASFPQDFMKKPIVIVGLMGAGKTTIGRKLACRLGLPFVDSDQAIEAKSGLDIIEFFEKYGETTFRETESRTIHEILNGEPLVLATGGGAFMNPATRQKIKDSASSIWLRCELSTLLCRVRRRTHRPLLNGQSHRKILKQLISERYPIYAQADITIQSGEQSVKRITDIILEKLAEYSTIQSTLSP